MDSSIRWPSDDAPVPAKTVSLRLLPCDSDHMTALGQRIQTLEVVIIATIVPTGIDF